MDHDIVDDGTSNDTELFLSGCPHNAAYYNIYNDGDGLGWHFDRSDFGVNLELQTAKVGGDFEICLDTKTSGAPWSFGKVASILQSTPRSLSYHDRTSTTQRRKIQEDSKNRDKVVGPGSLVIFAGSNNLHRVTPVQGDSSRINAIMTYERKENQKMNAYSLKKFFGVTPEVV